MMVLPGSCHFESLVSYVSERMFAECDGRMVFNCLEDGILNFMIRGCGASLPHTVTVAEEGSN